MSIFDTASIKSFSKASLKILSSFSLSLIQSSILSSSPTEDMSLSALVFLLETIFLAKVLLLAWPSLR